MTPPSGAGKEKTVEKLSERVTTYNPKVGGCVFELTRYQIKDAVAELEAESSARAKRIVMLEENLKVAVNEAYQRAVAAKAAEAAVARVRALVKIPGGNLHVNSVDIEAALVTPSATDARKEEGPPKRHPLEAHMLKVAELPGYSEQERDTLRFASTIVSNWFAGADALKPTEARGRVGEEREAMVRVRAVADSLVKDCEAHRAKPTTKFWEGFASGLHEAATELYEAIGPSAGQPAPENPLSEALRGVVDDLAQYSNELDAIPDIIRRIEAYSARIGAYLAEGEAYARGDSTQHALGEAALAAFPAKGSDT